MDRRRFFNKSSLTESFDTKNTSSNLFEDTMTALYKLYEDVEEKESEEDAEKEKETEADGQANAQETPADNTAEKTEANDAPAEKAEASDDSFNPVYKDIKEIKNKVNTLSGDEAKQIEDPTIKLTGEPDKLYDSLIDILNNSKLASAVEILNTVAGDNKLSKLLQHGFNAESESSKQIDVTVSPDTSLPTKSLVPTQNVVVVGNSLDNLIQGYFTKKDDNGEKVPVNIDYTNYFSGDAPVPQPFVYQAGSKNYIIDGHHRWSQAYCMNPFGTVKCVVVTGPDIGADAVLKNFQAAIAINKDALPVGSGSGDNLFEASPSLLVGKVSDMSEETAEKIMAAGRESKAVKAINEKVKGVFKDGSDDLKTARALLVNNALMLKTSVTPGTNEREIMPQADTKAVVGLINKALPLNTSK